jgi:hypothetical protein
MQETSTIIERNLSINFIKSQYAPAYRVSLCVIIRSFNHFITCLFSSPRRLRLWLQGMKTLFLSPPAPCMGWGGKEKHGGYPFPQAWNAWASEKTLNVAGYVMQMHNSLKRISARFQDSRAEPKPLRRRERKTG